MALFIVDGVPGAGKTLNTIKEVRDRAIKESRPVYYNYITELSPDLGWQEMSDEEIQDWHNQLPEGAILVIDEAWRIFPKWESKKQPPEFVLAFFQHRKKGHDVYLIVQSARVQLDPVVYENTEAHVHFQRVAGSQLVKRYEWNGSVGNPKAATSIAKARIKFTRLDPEIFKLYKSAELHTHRFRLPMKFTLAVCLLLFVLGFAVYKSYIVNRDFFHLKKPEAAVTAQALPPAGNVVADPRPTFASPGSDNALDPSVYVPRVEHLPWTAPVYDSLRQPKSFPRVAGCIYNPRKMKCTCYTQQATVLAVPEDFCGRFVRGGQFDDQIPDDRGSPIQSFQQPPQIAQEKPVKRVREERPLISN